MGGGRVNGEDECGLLLLLMLLLMLLLLLLLLLHLDVLLLLKQLRVMPALLMSAAVLARCNDTLKLT